jgi:hypothetical protein
VKKLIIILLAHIYCHSNLFAQCEPSTFVFSISPGVTQSGAYLAMEGGIWPIDGKLGFMAGALMYDEKVIHDKGTEKLTQIDLSGRVIYKLTKVGSNCPQLITAFATVRGLLGASYRAYWSIGETQLLGVEPMYVNRLGVGVNILFTTGL